MQKKKGAKPEPQIKQNSNKNSLVFASQLGLQNPTSMTKFPPTITDEWRIDAKVATDATGQFSLFFSLRNPTTAINGSGTYPRAPLFAQLYDEYCIKALTVVLDPVQLQVQTGHVGIAADYDSVPSGTYTFSDLRDNQYLRDFRAINQISYAAKEVPLSEGTYRGSAAVIHQKGWYDFNTPPDEGYIVVTGEDFTPNAAVGRVLLTMKVKMRRRRTIANARELRYAHEKAMIAHEGQGPVTQQVPMFKPEPMVIDLPVRYQRQIGYN